MYHPATQQAFFLESLRLNRWLAGALGAILLAQAMLIQTPQHWLAWTLWGLGVVLVVGFALANAMVLKPMRQARLTEETLSLFEKRMVVMCLAGALSVGGVFLGTSGNGPAFLLGLVPLFQAQILGQRLLARQLMVWLGGVLLLGALLFSPIPRPSPTWLSSLGFWLTVAVTLGIFLQFSRQLRVSVYDLGQQVGRLQSLAAIDSLTGLMNRRQFNHQLNTEISRARRHHHALTLVLFDIDDFKKINDFYGHPTGDRILKELGQLIVANVRESDIPARYGGEEFALILPETRLSEAVDFLERLRHLVEQTVFCLPDLPITLSISVGIAPFEAERHTVFDFVGEADAALYEAKNQGKNRVISSTSLSAPGLMSMPFAAERAVDLSLEA